ncbi:MAG: ribose-phosphate pyrophosphokinase [Clostridiales Family XIII bacterium]|jgi:ribose-phosphate pyrophosphokinase|nr:ribose-phosphate pyrophosphokinase [Clostridiales Family XIII bacterium]
MKNGSACSEYKLFCGNACPELAAEIAQKMGKRLGKSEVTTFSDGEISVNIYETVRGRDVFIIQSTCYPTNENLMELLIMIDAMKRASAGRINAVVPYYGYGRQDRKAKARDPITAKLVADLITAAGADRVVTMDLHASQIQGYFNIPVDHLLGMPILMNYFKKKKLPDLVVVSPDHGSVTRARAMSIPLGAPIAIVDKRRQKANESEVMNVIGEIEGKTCLLVDDMVDTAGSITHAANAIAELGAKEVYACATHGILSGKALSHIEKSSIREMVFLNTVPLSDAAKKVSRIKVLSVAGIFAEAMLNIHTDDSVSKIFEIAGNGKAGK